MDAVSADMFVWRIKMADNLAQSHHQTIRQTIIQSTFDRAHMTKDQLAKWVVSFVVVVLALSAIGYLFFPSAMLSVVGISSSPQMEFLVRTLAAAFVAMIPSAWRARNGGDRSIYASVLLGLALYMFVSSAVDLQGFLTDVVNSASIPSIIVRVLLGGVLLWLMV